MIRFLRKYIGYQTELFALFFLFAAVFAAAFALYRLPLKAVLYPSAVCAVFGIMFLLWKGSRSYKKHCFMKKIESFVELWEMGIPSAGCMAEEDYRDMLFALSREHARMENNMNLRFTQMMDYYTLWVHQIKTPISSMRLSLQAEDTNRSRQLLTQLSRIEQYVEMVLCYLRLDSDTTDYLFKEYSLDDIICPVIKKSAGQFIAKKLSLHYEPVAYKAVTDEKWLAFVLEQILGNAVKYTVQGGVSIYMSKPDTLCIEDTGIGIAPEDLPRIFDRGYTGCNGRSDKRASGIGLYLCRRICDNLGHKITVSSVPDEGTTVEIEFVDRKLT